MNIFEFNCDKFCLLHKKKRTKKNRKKIVNEYESFINLYILKKHLIKFIYKNINKKKLFLFE